MGQYGTNWTSILANEQFALPIMIRRDNAIAFDVNTSASKGLNLVFSIRLDIPSSAIGLDAISLHLT